MAVSYSAYAKTLSGSGVLYTDRRDFYIRPNVLKELWTDVAPFTTVAANQRVMTNIPDPLFKMFEHENPWAKQQFYNNGSTVTINSNGTESNAITVDNITGLSSTVDKSWEGLQCEVWDSTLTTKRGVVLITDGDTTTAIDVKHLWNEGTTASIATVDNDVFIVIGNAHGEGETAPEAWSDELSVVFNSAQIFKKPLEITGTLLEASLRGEADELGRLRLQKSQEHKIQKENAFLRGASLIGTGLESTLKSDTFGDASGTNTRTGASGASVRTTFGIIPAIEDHGAESGDDQTYFEINEASYEYGDWVDDMEKVFQYVPDSGMKRAFCGMGAMSYWSKMQGTSGMAGNSGWTVNMSDMRRDALGFNYRILESPHGLIQLIPTPALRGPYNKSMLIVSEENLFIAQYRAPKFQANIKTDDAYDGVKDQYFSDEGIGVTLVKSHKYFKIV